MFTRLNGALDPTRIHRFLVGVDSAPRPMTAAESAKLGDPFATLVLRKGVFPKTAEGCLKAIDDAVGKTNRLRRQMTFLLGETSQLPAKSEQRSIRFVITRGANANGPAAGPDVLISVGGPKQKGIELMAWDRRRGGFNYYRSVGKGPTWVFAGNARDALAGQTQGSGPFESHKSGAFLMKELKLPWVNWHSPEAPITRRDFPDGDPRTKHPWFTKKEPGGAYTFEFAVARPAIERWARVRFDAIAARGVVNDPRRIMEQVLTSPTFNLASSNVESRRAVTGKADVDLPPTFFADVDGLGEAGVFAGDLIEVKRGAYKRTLERFKVKVENGQGFRAQGDTHFAFPIPERAFEDVVTIREAVRIGLLTRRLVASLLMVDFANPIISERRAALLKHVPPSATIKKGKSTFSRDMADAILAAAGASDAGSPEREFAERWKTGADFETKFARILRKYFVAVKKQAATQAGFDDYWRLADARRLQARENPVFREFELTFPKSRIPDPARHMKPDATVA